ncbi:MAG: FAD binding domain-containing protein [Pirellulaceae bacterium]|jgi:xanthine dehydrogenase YagS FAD-binding subunit|nr:FAD binding domain-containing protein [Pirellulaceae bacterium]
MKNFEYAAPRTETEAVELLSPEAGQVEVLAGGTDLVGLMKKMIIKPDRVVNITEIDSLKRIEPLDDGGVRIGAAVTLDEVLEHPYLENYPAVLQAIRGINSMQLQCQGTLGGEVCQRPRCWFWRNGEDLIDTDVEHGDNRFHAIFGNSGPAKFVSSSRIAPALIALNASLRLIGPGEREERYLPVGDFYRVPRRTGQRENVLDPQQMVSHILLPSPHEGWLNATYEVRAGEGPEFPLASAAAALQVDGLGVIQDARVVLGQVAPTPWVSEPAQTMLRGLQVDPEVAEAAGREAVSEATPLSENGYKVQLARVAVKRALLLATGQETGGF